MGAVVWQVAVRGQVDGDVALVAQGVGVVQVPDVDAEEVSKPNDRCRGIPTPPSGISRRKWAEAERVHPAVARMAQAVMASSTRRAP